MWYVIETQNLPITIQVTVLFHAVVQLTQPFGKSNVGASNDFGPHSKSLGTVIFIPVYIHWCAGCMRGGVACLRIHTIVCAERKKCVGVSFWY